MRLPLGKTFQEERTQKYVGLHFWVGKLEVHAVKCCFPASGPIQTYSCCQGDSSSDGCQVHSCHVTDVLDFNDMRGFVATLDKKRSSSSEDQGVFALDCEMCNTVRGNELTRVTVVGLRGDTVYESLVRPEDDIIDYNTRFSGISASDLQGVTTTLRDVQAILLSMFNSKTILIGHSLESDLKALKVSGTVTNTPPLVIHLIR